MESTQVAAVESLFSSINPTVSHAADLNKALANAVQLMVVFKTPLTSVRKAIYDSLTKVFDRVRKAGKGDSIDFDSTNLKILLSRPDETIEALRLARVDAIKEINISAPLLSSKMSAEE